MSPDARSLLRRDPDGQPTITPADAGWSSAGLAVRRLGRGTAWTYEAGDREAIVLPLAGGVRV